MRKNIRLFIFFTAITILFAGCKKEEAKKEASTTKNYIKVGENKYYFTTGKLFY